MHTGSYTHLDVYKRQLQQQLEIDMKQGFTRLEVNGEMMRIDEYKPKAGDTVFPVSYTHLEGYKRQQ